MKLLFYLNTNDTCVFSSLNKLLDIFFNDKHYIQHTFKYFAIKSKMVIFEIDEKMFYVYLHLKGIVLRVVIFYYFPSLKNGIHFYILHTHTTRVFTHLTGVRAQSS